MKLNVKGKMGMLLAGTRRPALHEGKSRIITAKLSGSG
jgi:hypothetical protein